MRTIAEMKAEVRSTEERCIDTIMVALKSASSPLTATELSSLVGGTMGTRQIKLNLRNINRDSKSRSRKFFEMRPMASRFDSIATCDQILNVGTVSKQKTFVEIDESDNQIPGTKFSKSVEEKTYKL